jgi:hypothetical protein
MGVEATRNSFRAAVLSGVKPAIVVTDKDPRLEGDRDSLDSVAVPRSEVRRGDHREVDRHRLSSESSTIVYEGAEHDVEVVNLSSGGAMIRCGFAPKLWDLVDLQLGDGLGLQGAVRWIKGDCIGLEFAHETRIECSRKERSELLLAVIQRSFPDAISLDEPDYEDDAAAAEDEDLGDRDEKRHPLIWKGEIIYAHDTNPVRIRNISAGGALVEVAVDYPTGAEVMLDLGDAGQFFTTVQWVCGDQVGLRFVQPFDLACLANARPEVTPHKWNVPTFLNPADYDEDAAWDVRWGRSSIEEIRSSLEGYLKR